jgi:transmembrane sensor
MDRKGFGPAAQDAEGLKVMNVRGQIDHLIALQAAQWYERTKNDEPGRNEDFVRWVSESPRHMEAFLAVASEAALVRKVLSSGTFDLEHLLRHTTAEVLPLPVRANLVTEADTKPVPERRPMKRVAPWAAAAAVVVLTALGVLLYQTVLSWQRFETPVGEQRTVQLAEGSVVNLNALSRVDVRIDEHTRDIRLTRGEATFKVAPDRTRPFRVHTPDAIVEAVGTQFNVYARPDGTTTVSVLEGKVKVSRELSRFGRARAAEPVPVAAGEQARVGPDGRIDRLKNMDVAESIAWQQRKLIFKRTPLEEMAEEFNRYNKATRIRVEGLEPGLFRFTGAFNADDPQSFAALLRQEPDLAVEERDGEIVVRPLEVAP